MNHALRTDQARIEEKSHRPLDAIKNKFRGLTPQIVGPTARYVLSRD